MQNIKFENTYQYNIKFMPTRRSRKPRYQTMEETTDFEVQNLLSIQAPIAFKIHEWNDSYAKALGRKMGKDNVYVDYPIRYYKGKYYQECIKLDVDNHTASFIEGKENIVKAMKLLSRSYLDLEASDYHVPDKPFDPNVSEDLSYVEGNPKKDRKNEIQDEINKRFIVIENRLYMETSYFGTGEPRYVINTLGLGHNYGGTYLSVDFEYNENLGKDRYFRADQFEEATKVAIKIALDRGDTEYSERIKQNAVSKATYIEVINSSAVQLHPSKEAGNGDPFMNQIDSIISGSPDKLTAGLGVIAAAANKIDKNRKDK